MSISTQQLTKRYALGVSLLALVVAVALVATGHGIEDVWPVLVLAAVNAIAERSSISITRTTQLSICLLPTLFAALLWGPLAAALVNAASMLGDPELFGPRDAERAPRLKLISYGSARFITGAAAGVTAEAVMAHTGTGFRGLLVATFASALVAELLDITSSATAAWARGRKPQAIYGVLGPILLTQIPIYAPLVAALALAYRDVSPWTAPLFFIPALAAQRLYGMYQREHDMAETLERANVEFAVALVTALEASDAYTAGHSRAVAIYCRDIAERMGLSDKERDRAFLCGLVHDIGKVGLPASLLGKDGPLTLDERRLMQEHSAIGERILREIATYDDVATVVRHHHERIDGEGYPDGIRGSEMPLFSKIIGVADAYNAMTSNRPYREAMPTRVARLRLAQAVETQFDTSVVAAFEAILASADENYRTATSDEFVPGTPTLREVGVAQDSSTRDEVALGAA